MRLFVLILFLLPALLPTTVFADNTQEFQLSNGLKLIVREDDRAPVVVSSIWYKVGGSYENNGTTGISHMLEHMMFRGTKKFGEGVLNKALSAQGSDQNAVTTDDYTMYHQLILSNQLPLCFELEADRMQNLLLDPAAFSKEKQVVLDERRMRVDDSPEGITWERFAAAAFVNNPYHNPVVGWMTDVENLSINDVRLWYQKWYGPNNAVIVVVGNVKPEAVYLLAQKYFGDLKPIPIPVLKPRVEVASLGERAITVAIPAKLPYFMMGFNVPTLATAKPEQIQSLYALKVLSAILSSGESARLTRDLVRKKEIAVTADASYNLYDLHQSLFVLSGIPTAKHSVIDLKNALWSEINELKTQTVTQAELDRVKAQLIASNVYKKDSLSKQADDLGEPEMAGLSWRTSDQFVSRMESVTPLQIQVAAQLYLTAQNETTAELKPTQ